MAQRVKVSTAKPDDLSSVTGTHMVEGTDSLKLVSELHMCTMVLCKNTQNNETVIK